MDEARQTVRLKNKSKECSKKYIGTSQGTNNHRVGKWLSLCRGRLFTSPAMNDPDTCESGKGGPSRQNTPFSLRPFLSPLLPPSLTQSPGPAHSPTPAASTHSSCLPATISKNVARFQTHLQGLQTLLDLARKRNVVGRGTA